MRISQTARVTIYALLAPLLMVGIFLLGDDRWIAITGIVLLVLLTAFERCPACGGALMMFGAHRLPGSRTLVCRSCGQAGGPRPPSPADPLPPSR